MWYPAESRCWGPHYTSADTVGGSSGGPPEDGGGTAVWEVVKGLGGERKGRDRWAAEDTRSVSCYHHSVSHASQAD